MGWPGERQRHAMSARGIPTKDLKRLDRIGIDDWQGEISLYFHPPPSDEALEAAEREGWTATDEPEIVLKTNDDHPDTWSERGGSQTKIAEVVKNDMNIDLPPARGTPDKLLESIHNDAWKYYNRFNIVPDKDDICEYMADVVANETGVDYSEARARVEEFFDDKKTTIKLIPREMDTIGGGNIK